MSPTQRSRAIRLLKAREILRLRDFVSRGIEPEMLSRLIEGPYRRGRSRALSATQR